MNRLAQLLGRLRSYAPRSCIEGEAGSCTYAQLLDEVERWQRHFDEQAVRRGSVIGLRCDYSPTATAALLALFSQGSIVVLIPRDRAAQGYLADARATALLDIDSVGNHSWQQLPTSSTHALLEQLRQAGEGGLVIFTSGSTGAPKAALQSIERFLYKFRRPGRSLRTMAFLLFDHIAGLDTLFYTLSSGGTLIVTRRRDPHSVMRLIEAHAVEVLPTSPSFLRLLCATRDAGRYDLSTLKVITYGSEPMDPSTLERLNERFPHAQISQKYGTTETGSPRTVSRANDSLWLKIKSDGVQTRVIDGVLWLRGEGTILGYLNAPTPIDEQGWYCTGDLVEVEGEWIRFRGRSADTIKVGGEKVAPAEVEQTILELDFVRDAVVCGEAHALLGHVVTARVALADERLDAKEAARRIRVHCRQRLAAYQVPVRIDVVMESFANDRQKARRARLAAD